jgi:hypothetical protein
MALVVDFSNNISIRDQIHIYMSSCRGIARRGPIFNPSEHLREINVPSTDYRAAEVGVTVARHFYKMDRPRRHMESHGITRQYHGEDLDFWLFCVLFCTHFGTPFQLLAGLRIGCWQYISEVLIGLFPDIRYNQPYDADFEINPPRIFLR